MIYDVIVVSNKGQSVFVSICSYVVVSISGRMSRVLNDAVSIYIDDWLSCLIFENDFEWKCMLL